MNKLIGIILILAFTLSCESDKGKNIPTLDDVKADVSVVSFLADDWSLKQVDSLARLRPVLSEIFFGHVLSLPLDDSLTMYKGYRDFYELEVTQNIKALIDSLYPRTNDLQDEWQSTMAYYEYYFPERSLPDLYLLQTNLGIANFLFQDGKGRDGVGASLDFYLGEAFPYLQLARENPAFSQYNNRTFNRDHLVTKSVNAIVEDIVPPPAGTNMLNHMLREGKRIYILDQICVNHADSAVFEMKPSELTWCENNEFEIWNYFLENDLLYSTDQREFFKFIKPAPTSVGMPADSPGKTAIFIGHRIIEAFLMRNPKVGIKELLSISDQDILEASAYRPRRK